MTAAMAKTDHSGGKLKRTPHPCARYVRIKHGVSGADVFSVRAYLRDLHEVLDALGVENPSPVTVRAWRGFKAGVHGTGRAQQILTDQ